MTGKLPRDHPWEPFSARQLAQLKIAFRTWLQIRAEHDEALRVMLKSYAARPDAFAAQFAADIDHSALLQRLLSGKQPLPEPPEKLHGYPNYPDEDE